MPTFKSILLVCICCFFAGISSAQDRFDYFSKNQLKIAPIRLIFSPIEPGLELSYERIFHPHWSFEVTGNRIFALVTDVNINRRKGWLVGGEARFRFYSNKGMQHYIALGSSYATSNTEATFKFQLEDTIASTIDTLGYNDSFSVKRTTTFFTARIGKIIEFDRINLEFSIGLSIIYREGYQTGRINPEDNYYRSSVFTASYRGIHTDKGWGLRLPMQFRICYPFG